MTHHRMDRNMMMMIAIGVLILAVLYLYRENQTLKSPPKKVVKFAQPVVVEEKVDEKSVPIQAE
jgi:hypothetical protein